MARTQMLETTSPLAEFWEFAKDSQSVIAWVAKLSVAAPIVDIVANVGPPWPSRAGVAILTSLFQVIVLLLAFEFGRHAAHRLSQLRWAMAASAMFAIPSLMLYLNAYSSYVVDAPDRWNRAVVGSIFIDEKIEALYESDRSRWTPRTFLKEFKSQEAIWTSDSIAANRNWLLMTWLAGWACTAVVVSCFCAIQYRRHAASRARLGKKRELDRK